jgi:hypothetical protein
VEAPERVAVAILRAWVEPGTDDTLKIRITTAHGTTEVGRTIGVAADIDGACAIIRAWLEGFATTTGQSGEFPGDKNANEMGS